LFRWLLVLVLVLLAAFGGFAWTVVHPTVGVPRSVDQPTDAQKLWSFGFVGDTHAGMTDATVNQIFHRLAQSDVEFVLHLGDMVDQGESEAQWQSFLDLARQHRLRLLPVVGNHDVMSTYSDRGEIRFRRHFPWLPATYYHFRHRDINFLMLNSELSLLPGSKQRCFLDRQLSEHPGTTILCLHRPVFTCSDRDWANKYWRQLWLHSALPSTDAALVLSGHNHYYERTKPLDGVAYVTSGGGTTNTYAEETPNVQTATFKHGSPHYGIADVLVDRIEVRVLNLEGNVLDRFVVDVRKPHHPAGHQRNPGSIELPPKATLPQFSEDAPPLEHSDAFPRPW
jgi:predicted phosphodiesterase